MKTTNYILIGFLLLLLTIACKKNDPQPNNNNNTADKDTTCTFSVPASRFLMSTIVAHSDTTTIDGAEAVWVCSGVTYTDDGGATMVFLEENAKMNSIGGGSVIYAKKGAIVNADGGGDQIYIESKDQVINSDGSNLVILCSEVKFNYTDAPPNGCK